MATHKGHLCLGCAAGLFWQNDISPWFSVRAALSAAFTSLMYVDSGLADAGTAQQLEAFALTQLNYAMGAPFCCHAAITLTSSSSLPNAFLAFACAFHAVTGLSSHRHQA